MARAQLISRLFNVALANATEAARQHAISMARDIRDDAIRSGQTVSSEYTTQVNGIAAPDESGATVPGSIRYNFDLWGDLVPEVLEFIKQGSRKVTGTYQGSWFVLVNGVITTEFKGLPRGSRIHIVNDQPYHRKLEVDFYKSVHDTMILERARVFARENARGLIKAGIDFLHLAGPGPGPVSPRAKVKIKEVPYVLRGKFKQGKRKLARKHLRKDVRKGELMTYPALELSEDRRLL